MLCELCAKSPRRGPHTCKTCGNNLTVYRRLKTVGTTKEADKQFVERVGMHLQQSHERGGFTPAWYRTKETKCHCNHCGVAFMSSVSAPTCGPCVTMEMRYRGLVNTRSKNPALKQIQDEYLRRHESGLKVPNIFKELHRL